MAQVIKDVVTWLKQWFYTEAEVDTLMGSLQTQLNNKAETSTVSTLATTVDGKADAVHTHGNLQSDGQVGSTATNNGIVITDANGKISASTSIAKNTIAVGTSSNASKNVVTDANGKITTENKYSHPSTHPSSIITEASALNNIGTSANATQHDINDAVNTAIGTLQSINAIEVVTTKPSASASTMGKLYIVSENSKVNVYYTERSGTSPNYTYSWHKMDTDILDELSISWNDITNKPTSFTPSTHSHPLSQLDDSAFVSAYNTEYGKQLTTVNACLSDFITEADYHNWVNDEFEEPLTSTTNISTILDIIQWVDDNYDVGDEVSGKADEIDALGTTITLVNRGQTNEGCIIFNTIG